MTINSAKVRGAYIHIPFCDHICYYCDFNKVFMKISRSTIILMLWHKK
ncbi:hypothetical radical SAM family enzyme in heat shock gene cluster [Sporolactobacillus inulinus]|uniref:Hypothetical radical SAM family enzyme in heat shock gene cluster n=1 Tax=Sporolactobacillus inulinus TaxID=2078 RepID=A0A4Y1ZBB5_9BACL|nr:hypothetical radical SAM family enzyme in heat shock gene cluster [Sporolactobacillus inulinus]